MCQHHHRHRPHSVGVEPPQRWQSGGDSPLFVCPLRLRPLALPRGAKTLVWRRPLIAVGVHTENMRGRGLEADEAGGRSGFLSPSSSPSPLDADSVPGVSSN